MCFCFISETPVIPFSCFTHLHQIHQIMPSHLILNWVSLAFNYQLDERHLVKVWFWTCSGHLSLFSDHLYAWKVNDRFIGCENKRFSAYSFKTTKLNLVSRTTRMYTRTLKRKVRRKNNGWEGPNKTKALARVQRFLHRTLSNTLWCVHSTHPPTFIRIPSLPLTVSLNAFAFPGLSLKSECRCCVDNS